MGPEIIIPVVVLAVAVPLLFSWARSNLKGGAAAHLEEVAAPASRLTSAALRDLPHPPWRVVFEIAADRMGGIDHVLIGPPGVYAIQTVMDPLPSTPTPEPDARTVAESAVLRSDLDDALRRCSMASDRLIRLHWGAPVEGVPVAVDVHAGLTAVAGRSLTEWVADQPPALSEAQVDLAWQTVTTAIGRPDPLG